MTGNTPFMQTRRDFIKLTTGAGAGLTLGLFLPGTGRAAEHGASAPAMVEDIAFAPNAFVRIDTDNTVTIMIKHIEFGQGPFTGLSTLVAEELDADWSQIRPLHAPADASRYNNLSWGPYQGTGGSSGIANSYEQMRRAGAVARHMLVAAAAEQWRVPTARVRVTKGVLSDKASGRRARFGELAEAAARQPVPPVDQVRLKDPENFVLIGREDLPRKDTGKTSGAAVFTQDINLPGQLTAVVAHPPRFGARVRSYDDTATRQVNGVIRVVQIPTGVAVLARDFWTASKGRDALKIEWDENQASSASSEAILQDYKNRAEQAGARVRRQGDPDSALASAESVIEAAYEFPYLAHATMEPMNCVVRISENHCEVWNGCQMQTVDQMAVANTVGLKPEQVAIHTLFAGGSFGRRANPVSDYVVEAASIARAMDSGTPVKLVWSREDDTRAGYFRPMYYHSLRAGLDKHGRPIAWQHRIVGQSIISGTPFAGMIQNGIDPTSVEGASNLPYAIPNLSVELHTTEVDVPVLWWRSVGSTHTAFSTETLMDELAEKAGRDPVGFRMGLLDGHPRHQGVLKLAAEKAGWGGSLTKGRGRGVAVHESFNSYVAQVAEVTVHDDGGFSVDRVVCAVDCGVPVNPDVIRAQMEGGIGYGLSPVFMSAITIDNGRVRESNFHDYQVLRIDKMPDIEVHIVPSSAAPTGVGEPGTPVIAPAVANALYAATGQRLYTLPLQLAT